MRMRPRPCSVVIETKGFTRGLETGGPPGCSVPSAATRGPCVLKVLVQITIYRRKESHIE